MPRKTDNRTFLENTYRFLATYRKASAPTRLRAADRLAVMCGFLKIDIEDQEPDGGESPEDLAGKKNTDATVDKMLRLAKRGGDNGNQLSEGSSK